MNYIGYIRVSTARQGTHGVSLDEQKDAILRYAECNRFMIGLWLEEIETAAKRGRPVFNQAMKLLRRGKYNGLILHKLDRGARNLKDWAAIGELSDQGIEVHFVHESLDLQSRGGRLSADIQAVVSADYIRNLKEETRKGFYGRLKQGLYPLRAPLGYVDNGKGKPKTIHPTNGPLVRKAFKLYGTARYSYETLGEEMYRLGLRNRGGSRVTRNGLATMLHNFFYIGINHIKKTNESFVGIHESLISKALFDRVQEVLNGKINAKCQRHSFLFRRLLSCGLCGYSLTGELQKGHVYYRCHSKPCHVSFREETVAEEFKDFFQQFNFDDEEKEYFKRKLEKLGETWEDQRATELRNLNLHLTQIKDRLNRLTDAYLDASLDKEVFAERRNSLISDQKHIAENISKINEDFKSFPNRLEKFFELAGNAWLSFQFANSEEKRELIKIFTSNRLVNAKKLYLKPSIPFEHIVRRQKNENCSQQRDIPRTWDRILRFLEKLDANNKLPDLSLLSTPQTIEDTPQKQWKHDKKGRFTSLEPDTDVK